MLTYHGEIAHLHTCLGWTYQYDLKKEKYGRRKPGVCFRSPTRRRFYVHHKDIEGFYALCNGRLSAAGWRLIRDPGFSCAQHGKQVLYQMADSPKFGWRIRDMSVRYSSDDIGDHRILYFLPFTEIIRLVRFLRGDLFWPCDCHMCQNAAPFTGETSFPIHTTDVESEASRSISIG
jgi:hypothetical protein